MKPKSDRRRRTRKEPGPRSYVKRYDVAHVGSLALTPAEVERLLASVDDVRDSALLELAISTGIRRHDVVQLRLEGLDLERGLLTFYETKKHRTRTVPIDGRVLVTLSRYLKTLPRGPGVSPWLFPGSLQGRRIEEGEARDAGHLSGKSAWILLQKRLDAVGLTHRPFHALRATCYKLCKARGWSPEQAAALIGDTVTIAAEHYGTATAGELKEAARDRPVLPLAGKEGVQP